MQIETGPVLVASSSNDEVIRQLLEALNSQSVTLQYRGRSDGSCTIAGSVVARGADSVQNLVFTLSYAGRVDAGGTPLMDDAHGERPGRVQAAMSVGEDLYRFSGDDMVVTVRGLKSLPLPEGGPVAD